MGLWIRSMLAERGYGLQARDGVQDCSGLGVCGLAGEGVVQAVSPRVNCSTSVLCGLFRAHAENATWGLVTEAKAKMEEYSSFCS